MGLQGDLSTLDLTSLFQNLEGARKTGLLTVRDRDEPTELWFEEGKLSAIARPDRIGLVEYLGESGAVAPEAIERARKKRRRGQAVGAALVDGGELSSQDLAAIASARLVDDACELLASGAKRFEFAELEKAPASFDREERALSLGLPATSLLLESARRTDHWAGIREHLPSDSTHYLVAKAPRPSGDPAREAFTAEILALLDGSRTVREVVARFPTRRFDAYQALAELAGKQAIRPITAGDLERRVLELARRDRKKALSLLERGLEENPRHLGLLCAKAMLAERAGELEQASEALKLVVHLQLEGEATQDARATLAKLRKIDGKDPFAWERSLDLAIEAGAVEDALAHARRLVALYEEPGLHKKACAVHERVIEAFGETWDRVRDLARARAAAGDVEAAVRGLESHATARIAVEDWAGAARVYEEALAIAPGRKRTKDALHDVESGALRRRKARWKRRRRLAALLFLGFVAGPWIASEALARRAFVDATRHALVDGGDVLELRARLETLRTRWAWTATAVLDVEPLIEAIDALGARGSAGAPGPR